MTEDNPLQLALEKARAKLHALAPLPDTVSKDSSGDAHRKMVDEYVAATDELKAASGVFYTPALHGTVMKANDALNKIPPLPANPAHLMQEQIEALRRFFETTLVLVDAVKSQQNRTGAPPEPPASPAPKPKP